VVVHFVVFDGVLAIGFAECAYIPGVALEGVL